MNTLVESPPIPDNELERIVKLAEFNLDYSEINENLHDLCKLAASIAGTEISLVNLIDHYTQWTVSRYGIGLEQMPREESVCQYAIMDNEPLEIKDLTKDSRFNEKFYVKGNPNVKYYYGIPLELEDGNNIGVLCVLDKNLKELTPEKTELLRIIAREVVYRLTSLKEIAELKENAEKAIEDKRKVSHDIRGPIGGIIGLAEIVKEQLNEAKIDDVLEMVELIHKGGESVLELADTILSKDNLSNNRLPKKNEFTLKTLKEKLEKLYLPQAKTKNVLLNIENFGNGAHIPFPKKKMLQILGNIISNAIKFTPEFGEISVVQNLKETENNKKLLIFNISDSGVGISETKIRNIMNGSCKSSNGTEGENGFGFGLSLVKKLLDGIDGDMQISSELGRGSEFLIRIPV